ncbi:hypothetical protein QBC42DRAFT_13150, partial [Cladorrhinum samala]
RILSRFGDALTLLSLLLGCEALIVWEFWRKQRSRRPRSLYASMSPPWPRSTKPDRELGRGASGGTIRTRDFARPSQVVAWQNMTPLNQATLRTLHSITVRLSTRKEGPGCWRRLCVCYSSDPCRAWNAAFEPPAHRV